MVTYFFGTYEHQLDDKNRLRIPAKFRKLLVGEDGDKSYVFARGMTDGCIYVLPEDELQSIMEKLSDEKMGESSLATMLFTAVSTKRKKIRKGEWCFLRS